MNTSFNNNYSNSGSGRGGLRWALIALVLVFIAASIFLIVESGHKSGFPKADQEHSTTFEGMSSFINKGLTTDQVNLMIKDFSKFSPKANTVSINTTSLTPAPRDPNKVSPFVINFNLSIDSNPYKGVVSYFNLDSVRLVLYASSGKQVFDSGATSPLE